MTAVKYIPQAKRKESSMNECVQIVELEIFGRIVSAGNMAAAARELKLSPACVCNRVARLEKRLDGKLFHRTTREL